MLSSKFIYSPYQTIDNLENIIVDSAPTPATVLVLSHWPSIVNPILLTKDTSAGLVIDYLEQGKKLPEVNRVSTSHFDVDALVALFIILYPDQAFEDISFWYEVSCAGDFRTARDPRARHMTLLIESLADDLFKGATTYFSAIEKVHSELLCSLYKLSQNIYGYRDIIEKKEHYYRKTVQYLKNNSVIVSKFPKESLVVIEINNDLYDPEMISFTKKYFGLSKFSLHETTDCMNLLFAWQGRYQLIQRYESWVQSSKPEWACRRDFAGILPLLSGLDETNSWVFDGVWNLNSTLQSNIACSSSIPLSLLVDILRNYINSTPVSWNPYHYGK